MPATAITLTDGTTSVTLPADLEWIDEYAWQPVEQSTEYSVTGALIVDQAERQAGREITLAGEQDRSTLLRATLDQLAAWAAIPGEELTLTLRTIAHTVIFNHPNALEAAQLVAGAPIDTAGGGRYRITLRFLEI